ncbi:MAG: RNA polymerase sigma factor RpoS [Thiotrichaceae bacterium]|nr:RNA polymerase sigma factor RpoS [Thiotrichaceae bacterium]
MPLAKQTATKKKPSFKGRPAARGHDSIELYLREIESSTLLTADEEKSYGRLALQNDEKAREKMIVCNLRLVVKIARRYIGRGMLLPDLIEEGNLGLMHAVGKFDPEKGFRFSTYATWWIRQSIERALMNQTRTIRLPIHINKELSSYIKNSRELRQKIGREPTIIEVADRMGKTVAQLNRLLDYNEATGSLDMPVSAGSDSDVSTLMDFVSEETISQPREELETNDVTKSVDFWLNKLGDKHKEVIIRRFGLLGHQCSTLEQVGRELSLTRERVRQIQMDALKKLRRILENDGLNLENLLGE